MPINAQKVNTVYSERCNGHVEMYLKGGRVMATQKMTLPMMEYVVWVIEITAAKFFGGDKTAAYNTLKDSRLWQLYTDCYDVTHTLSGGYILEEMREYFIKNGIAFSESEVAIW